MSRKREAQWQFIKRYAREANAFAVFVAIITFAVFAVFTVDRDRCRQQEGSLLGRRVGWRPRNLRLPVGDRP